MNDAAGPLVSIVLPTHNGARFLSHSIASCLNQSHRNIELIIVDDASTDDTPNIIAGFAAVDGRVICVRHDKNRRLPAALNSGFAAATGEYLTWTSDDNLYEPDALELMVSFLKSRSSVGLVYCDMQQIDEDGMRLEPWTGVSPDQVRRGDATVGGCFLYRGDVRTCVGAYAEDMFLVEDLEYWLRVAQRFQIERIPGVAPYKLRRHGGSLTATRPLMIELQRTRALCRHVFPESQRRQMLRQTFHSSAWKFREQRDYRNAFWCLYRSLLDTGQNVDAYVCAAKVALHGLLNLRPCRRRVAA